MTIVFAMRNGKNTQSQPSLLPRIAGVLGIIIFIAAIFSEAISPNFTVVLDGAGGTIETLTMHLTKFRYGIIADGLVIFCEILYAFLLFKILLPVDRRLSLIAMMLRYILIGFLCYILFPNIQILNAIDFNAIDSSLFLLSVSDHTHIYQVGLLFFSLHLLILGVLVFQAEFLPRLIGLLLFISGICYLTNSISYFRHPEFNHQFGTFLFIPPVIGEMSFTLWLFFKGIKEQ